MPRLWLVVLGLACLSNPVAVHTHQNYHALVLSNLFSTVVVRSYMLRQTSSRQITNLAMGSQSACCTASLMCQPAAKHRPARTMYTQPTHSTERLTKTTAPLNFAAGSDWKAFCSASAC